MTAVEWLYGKMYENKGRISIEIFEKAKEMERNQIIRACNYSEMKHDELLKQAIEERRTIGEVYYDKMIKK